MRFANCKKIKIWHFENEDVEDIEAVRNLHDNTIFAMKLVIKCDDDRFILKK